MILCRELLPVTEALLISKCKVSIIMARPYNSDTKFELAWCAVDNTVMLFLNLTFNWWATYMHQVVDSLLTVF